MMLTAAALLGIVGALGCALSDVILLGVPTSGSQHKQNRFAPMLSMSQRRMLIGTVLGVISLPLTIAGLFQVHAMLAPAGPWLALPPVLLLGWMLAIGSASHGTWGFVRRALQARQRLVSAGEEPAELAAMNGDFRRYWSVIQTASGVLFMAGGLWLAAAILIGPTLYPLWILLFHPVLLMVLGMMLATALPAPLGGYVLPSIFNLGWAIFLAMSLLASCL